MVHTKSPSSFSVPKREILISLLLIFLTCSVYWQVKDFSFVNYDDPCYVYNNSVVMSGLSLESVKWAFTTMAGGNWHPLTWLSYLVDIELFGTGPGKLHLVNAALHVTSTILLFLALVLMTGALVRSAFVAALFALHPLHVESVAWISERKDVLSTLFWMLVIISYSWYSKKPYYSQKPSPARYILVLVLFLLGLMSKPMLVTEPFVLLLLDFWPLRRLQEEHYLKGQRLATKSMVLLLVWEKVPFFILSLVVGVGTVLAQMKSNALASVEALPVIIRIYNALISYVVYLFKTVWPLSLSVIYPHSGEMKLWEAIFSLLLLAAISFLAIKGYRRAPFLIVGWLWYLGTLLPVIGIVQVGEQAFADRYTYIPLIGVFIMVVWALSGIARRLNQERSATVLGVIILGILMILTYSQTSYWTNTISLLTHAIKIDPRNATGHNNLGWAYESEMLNLDSAIFQYSEALKLRPNADLYHRNIGRALANKGQHEEARFHLNEALRLRPNSAEAHDQLGLLLMKTDRIAEAIVHFSKAVEIEPTFADAHNNLGSALKAEGKLDLAILHFRKAILIKPDLECARVNLEKALLSESQQ